MPYTPSGLTVSRVGALGLNAWLIVLGLPLLLAEPTHVGYLLWLLPPLVALAAGALMLRRNRLVATWLLLGAFPMLLGGVAAGLPEIVTHDPYSSATVAIATLSLLGYWTAASLTTSRPERVKATSERPLGTVAPMGDQTRRARTRNAILIVTGTGAAALVLVAPWVYDAAAYAEAWGEAGPAAHTLTTLVAGALAAAGLALFIGPNLRAPRRKRRPRRRTGRRVLGFLVTVAIGVAVFLLYKLSA